MFFYVFPNCCCTVKVCSFFSCFFHSPYFYVFLDGLIECAVHHRRQVVNLATHWPHLQCEPQLHCIVGAQKRAPAIRMHRSAPMARAKLVALLREMHVAEREETVGGCTHVCRFCFVCGKDPKIKPSNSLSKHIDFFV